MRREIGGVPFDEAARLRFGDPENRATIGVARDAFAARGIAAAIEERGDLPRATAGRPGRS